MELSEPLTRPLTTLSPSDGEREGVGGLPATILSNRYRRPTMRNSANLPVRILAITNMYPSTEFPGRGVFVQEQVKGLCAIGVEVMVLFVDRRQEGPMAYYRMRRKIARAVAEFD